MVALLSTTLGTGGCVVLAITALVAALLFIPWREPSDRAERLLRAWRGLDRGPGSAKTKQRRRRTNGR
jgi:hypothetical protein